MRHERVDRDGQVDSYGACKRWRMASREGGKVRWLPACAFLHTRATRTRRKQLPACFGRRGIRHIQTLSCARKCHTLLLHSCKRGSCFRSISKAGSNSCGETGKQCERCGVLVAEDFLPHYRRRISRCDQARMYTTGLCCEQFRPPGNETFRLH